MKSEWHNTALEIAWRWFFLVFSIAVVTGVAFMAQDAVRLRAAESSALRSGNLAWMIAGAWSFFRRYPSLMESALLVMAAAISGFWILGGAALRAAARRGRTFLELVLLRALALGAGTAAVFACLAVIMTVTAKRLPPGPSAMLVSLFSLVVYLSWRWVSLLLAVLENAPSLSAGSATFVRSGPWLFLTAASNSTLKGLAVFVATAPAAALVAALARLPGRHGTLELAVVGAWLVSLACISGYFAARLRDKISDQIEGWAWTTDSPSSQGG
jgi:hypothetical protein